MSNKVSENLFKLIKSLSKPEKRYFKVYSSRHTLGDKNNYQILFDAIDKQKEYDEDAIKKKFAKEAFVKKFSIAKSRLYDAILRSLDAYHANSSIDAQLKRLLHCAEILYKKTLYNQSYKVLRSAKKLAYKYEKHTTLMEIFKWEKLLVEKDNYTEVGEQKLNEINEEDHLIMEKIKNFSDFWYIKSRLFYILNKKGKARTSEELSNFKAIIDNVLLKSEDRALHYETKYLYYHIYSAYYFGVGDYQNSYINLIKNVEHIEENIEMFKEEPNVYFSILTNIIYVASQLKKYDDVFLYLKKLRALPETMLLNSNEDLDIKLFSSAYSIELTIYSLTGTFEKGIELVPIIEDGFKLYGRKINNVRRAYLYFNIAILYFGAGRHNEALRWTNRLLNDVDIDKSEDIHCFAQLLNLIIHIELGNQRLVPYALKSTYRYLSTRNRVYKFETMVLNFISKILKIKDEERITDAYLELKQELLPLEQDQFEKTAFEYFDFISWAESKVSGRTFKEVVTEKAKLPPKLAGQVTSMAS
jgi:hypothetical protein